LRQDPAAAADATRGPPLRAGFAGGRFEAPLEAEYRLSHLARARRRVRIVFSLGAALVLWSTAWHVGRLGVRSAWTLLDLGIVVPASLAMLWVAWSRRYAQSYLPVAQVLVPVLWGLIAIFVARDLVEGRPELLAGLAVSVVALFFFTGLMFRQALVACATMLLAFALAAHAMGLPAPVLMRCMVVLGSTAIIGAIIGADVERSYRLSFLEAALIGQLATRDGLTGLMNRRAFDEHLLRVWQHAIRARRNVAVLMIDIDLFKQYNDTHGHQAGDDALRRVAQVINGFAKRPLDLAARYGGEEFAVILYDLGESHVTEIAERLRRAVEAARAGRTGGGDAATETPVTVSVGAGIAAPAIGRGPDGAVQLADEALYEAKARGRNCIVVRGVEAYGMLHTGDFVSPERLRRGS